MASIQETISWLEELPKDIGEKGKEFVRSSIQSHGHVVTGNMLKSVQASVSGDNVRIRVWRYYATYVNDGRGTVVPRRRKTWKRRNVSKLHWVDPRYGEVFTPYAAAYPGSHFFDEAFDQLKGYIASL